MSEVDIGSNLEAPVKIQRARTSKPDTVKIILEENDDIPPNGLFIGHNGKGYLVRAGEPVDLPRYLLEILDHAVMSSPQIDPTTRQVIGYRERMKYPYRFVN